MWISGIANGQSIQIPSDAKYGCIVAVDGITIPFPVWLKCGVSGNIEAGHTTANTAYRAKIEIGATSLRAAAQGFAVVWYG